VWRQCALSVCEGVRHPQLGVRTLNWREAHGLMRPLLLHLVVVRSLGNIIGLVDMMTVSWHDQSPELWKGVEVVSRGVRVPSEIRQERIC
jgi:hypothetical protein